jgi:hypothetical protein
MYCFSSIFHVASYRERDYLYYLFWFKQVVCLLAFPWPSFFVSFVMVPAMKLLLDFF